MELNIKKKIKLMNLEIKFQYMQKKHCHLFGIIKETCYLFLLLILRIRNTTLKTTVLWCDILDLFENSTCLIYNNDYF